MNNVGSLLKLNNKMAVCNVTGDQPLTTPGIPTLVVSKFTSIQILWNASSDFNGTQMVHVVEVQPHWKYNGENVTNPFIPRYHHVSYF